MSLSTRFALPCLARRTRAAGNLIETPGEAALIKLAKSNPQMNGLVFRPQGKVIEKTHTPTPALGA